MQFIFRITSNINYKIAFKIGIFVFFISPRIADNSAFIYKIITATMYMPMTPQYNIGVIKNKSFQITGSLHDNRKIILTTLQNKHINAKLIKLDFLSVAEK